MLCCIMFRLKAADRHRIESGIPALRATIESFAVGKPELVFLTDDYLQFAWFLETRKPLPVIRAACEARLRDQEGVLVFEATGESAGWGSFTRQHTWLTHRRTDKDA